MTDEGHHLQRRVDELQAASHFAQSLSSSMSILESIETVADWARQTCNAESASVVVFNTDKRATVNTIARTGTPGSHQIDHWLNMLLAGWIKTKRTVFRTDDVVRSLHFSPSVESHPNIGPALAIPLTVGEKLVGSLHLARVRGGLPFTEEEERLARLTAPLAGRYIERARAHEAVAMNGLNLRGGNSHRNSQAALLGDSLAMQEVRRQLTRVAPTCATVLLIGETGTGKDLAARVVHCSSTRAAGPFVDVNCSAIPAALAESELFGHERGAFTDATSTQKGKFEMANGGTLFLDEVTAMPLDLQPKLLRVLEQRTVTPVGSSDAIPLDVRIIAATDTSLEDAVQKGRFREDLYHRLNVVPITIPPLRDHVSDIPLLAGEFLHELSGGSLQFAEDAIVFLQTHIWKGNIRELRNVVERATIFAQSNQITVDLLRTLGVGPAGLPTDAMRSVLFALLNSGHKANLLEVVERDLVEAAILQTGGNVSRAASLLGLDRMALHRRLEKFGLPAAGTTET